MLIMILFLFWGKFFSDMVRFNLCIMRGKFEDDKWKRKRVSGLMCLYFYIFNSGIVK